VFKAQLRFSYTLVERESTILGLSAKSNKQTNKPLFEVELAPLTVTDNQLTLVLSAKQEEARLRVAALRIANSVSLVRLHLNSA
jgi:hypothetical protein